MEVSRRRILQKHLEPARPLRRSPNGVMEPNVNVVATCAQALMKEVDQEKKIGIEQLFKILNLHKQKAGRICYKRDFLIGLANSPESRKKPDFLPDHPIVLTQAIDAGYLNEMRRRGGKKDFLLCRAMEAQSGWMGNIAELPVSPEMFDWVKVKALAETLKDVQSSPYITLHF